MRKLLLSLTIMFGLLMPALGFSSYAAACPASGSSGDQVLSGIGQSGNCAAGEKTVSNTISNIVQLISIFAGVLAVIMIIVSGIRYITSGGDANKVGSAKSALIAALIGLVIAALAQLMVQFVITRSSAVSDPCKYDSSIPSTSASCVAPKSK